MVAAPTPAPTLQELTLATALLLCCFTQTTSPVAVGLSLYNSHYVISAKKGTPLNLRKVMLYLTLTDITSCKLRNGGCDHICIMRAEGHVQCRCRTGWKLGQDLRSCVGET